MATDRPNCPPDHSTNRLPDPRQDHPAPLARRGHGKAGQYAGKKAGWRFAAGGLATGLRFLAAPTFAFMALLTALAETGDLCLSAAAAPAVGGMVPMYLLMSAFHCAPWLRALTERPGATPAPTERVTNAYCLRPSSD